MFVYNLSASRDTFATIKRMSNRPSDRKLLSTKLVPSVLFLRRFYCKVRSKYDGPVRISGRSFNGVFVRVRVSFSGLAFELYRVVENRETSAIWRVRLVSLMIGHDKKHLSSWNFIRRSVYNIYSDGLVSRLELRIYKRAHDRHYWGFAFY